MTYIQKCINSILATKNMPGKIIVADDGSTDGTLEWLNSMRERGKIDTVIKCKRLGTAKAFNEAVNYSQTNIVIVSNDDMYFHRGWGGAIINTFKNAQRCGIVTFYDYARATERYGVNNAGGDYDLISVSGMGCTAIDRKLFHIIKGFNLPADKKMGYFASEFCNKANQLSWKFPNNNYLHYITRPNYATHIDHPQHPLCDRDILQEYCEFRSNNKKGKTEQKYKTDYNL